MTSPFEYHTTKRRRLYGLKHTRGRSAKQIRSAIRFSDHVKYKSGYGVHTLNPKSFLGNLFSCANCWWLGTDRCPFGLTSGQKHTNHRCDDYVTHELEIAKVLGNVNGKKLLRDRLIIEMAKDMEQIRYVSHLVTSQIKSAAEGGDSTPIPLDRLEVFKAFRKQSDMLLDHLSAAIKQDEGTTIKHEDVVTKMRNVLTIDGRVSDMSRELEVGQHDDGNRIPE